MKKKLLIKISGLCGILIPFVFLANIIISLQMASWFDWTKYAISDLGMPEGGGAFFNNNMILTGILLFIFSLSFFRIYKFPNVGSVLIMLSSFFLMGIGIFPLPDINHVYISGLFFTGFVLGLLVIGIKSIRRMNDFIRQMGYFALVIFVISIASPVLLIFFEGIAIPEIISVGPFSVWCMIYGFRIVKNDIISQIN